MSKIETVAIIDDDDIYQFATKKFIKATNLIESIYTFFDGEEAIDYFKLHKHDNTKLPDIIFLDLNMPIIDGWQFLEDYSLFKDEIKKEIIIYIVTSSINPDDLIKARSIRGISDYLVKPMTTKKFLEILKA